MTIQEYFGDWSGIVNTSEADKLLRKIATSGISVCPLVRDVFKAFSCCPFHDLKVVMMGQDPYPDIRKGKPTATGIAFGNSPDTLPSCYSPSLDVLIESIIDFTYPHGNIIFDPTLERWERQGVLMLNSALSCQAERPGSHALMWRPFMKTLLKNLSLSSSGIVYVLMGTQAQSFEDCINPRYNYIIRERHPSWYARNHIKLPGNLWHEINKILKGLYGHGIEWYSEYNNFEKEDEKEVFYERN